jgi:NAD(P)-dependent dehydrogenase (short-subunit alcohol dehydrogenase family)
MAKDVALIVGVGPGLGAALARRFAQGGLAVAVAARRVDALSELAREIGGRAYACDATEEDSVSQLFAAVERDLGRPTVVVYNAGAFSPGSVLEINAAEFERCWRALCLGGFLVGQRAARVMVEAGRGTILLTGATASLRGGARFANLAVGKFGLRALAQSMARELGPKGVHVAHIIIDGQIRSERYAELEKQRPADGLLDPDAIAEAYWHLHMQTRSAWTLEIDLRPWVEKF